MVTLPVWQAGRDDGIAGSSSTSMSASVRCPGRMWVAFGSLCQSRRLCRLFWKTPREEPRQKSLPLLPAAVAALPVLLVRLRSLSLGGSLPDPPALPAVPENLAQENTRKTFPFLPAGLAGLAKSSAAQVSQPVSPQFSSFCGETPGRRGRLLALAWCGLGLGGRLHRRRARPRFVTQASSASHPDRRAQGLTASCLRVHDE